MEAARSMLWEGLKEAVWPTRCVGCDRPGELLCDGCRRSLGWIDQRYACPNCGAPYGWMTCTECSWRDDPWETRCVVCALTFDAISSQLVACLKDAHELRLAAVNAEAVACALDEAALWDASDGLPRYDAAAVDALCFVPATARAYARRGFDHMELVSQELSAILGIPLADVLVRDSRRDQRELGREDRQRNLAGSIEVVDDVSGMRLLLADDVVTTGASMRACAKALLARGAESVIGCALARVW